MEFKYLPPDTIGEIYTRLSLIDRKNISLVSREINDNLAYSNSNITRVEMPILELHYKQKLDVGTVELRRVIVTIELNDRQLSVSSEKIGTKFFSKIPSKIYDNNLYQFYYFFGTNWNYILVTPFYFEIHNDLDDKNDILRFETDEYIERIDDCVVKTRDNIYVYSTFGQILFEKCQFLAKYKNLYLYRSYQTGVGSFDRNILIYKTDEIYEILHGTNFQNIKMKNKRELINLVIFKLAVGDKLKDEDYKQIDDIFNNK